MISKKTILAAVGVLSLAAPAAAFADDWGHGAHRDGGYRQDRGHDNRGYDRRGHDGRDWRRDGDRGYRAYGWGPRYAHGPVCRVGVFYARGSACWARNDWRHDRRW